MRPKSIFPPQLQLAAAEALRQQAQEDADLAARHAAATQLQSVLGKMFEELRAAAAAAAAEAAESKASAKGVAGKRRGK